MATEAVLILASFNVLWLLQGSLLHPVFENNRIARCARAALAPILVWLAFRIPDVLFISGAERQVTLNFPIGMHAAYLAFRVVEYGAVKGPYWRVETKVEERPDGPNNRNSHEKRVDRRSKESLSPGIVDLFIFAVSLCFSDPRGFDWSWGVPSSLRRRPSGQPIGRFVLRKTVEAVILNLVSLAALAVDLPALARGKDSSALLYYGILTSLDHHPWVRQCERYVAVVLSGVLVYVNIDLSWILIGTLFPATLIAIARAVLPEKLAPEPFQPDGFPPVMDRPYLAQSLAEFWTLRWHSLMRRTFVICGSVPLSKLLSPFGRNAKRVGAVLGAFIASGVLHEIGFAITTRRDPALRMAWFFGLQGVGMIIESTFSSITGRRVGGLTGWLWALVFLTLTARPMVESVIERGALVTVTMPLDWRWYHFLVPMTALWPASSET